MNISHTYYRDSICKDFDFIVPAETKQWLNNGRLIAKVREGKLYVLFEVGEDNNPLVSIAGQTLRFGLKLNNLFFSNFTKLGIHSVGAFLYKNTANNPHQLASPENIQMTSLNVELQRQGVVGMIEITLDNNNFYTTDPKKAPEFKIAFEAKEEILKYYVVAKNYTDAEVNQLTVSDQGGSGITFVKVSSDKFTKDEISPSLLGNVVLFKSQAMVKLQEEVRKKIQLNKNGSVLMDNLPQPTVSKANADIIIQLSKP